MNNSTNLANNQNNKKKKKYEESNLQLVSKIFLISPYIYMQTQTYTHIYQKLEKINILFSAI